MIGKKQEDAKALEDLRIQKIALEKDIRKLEDLSFQDERILLESLEIQILEYGYSGADGVVLSNEVIEHSDEYHITVTDLLKVIKMVKENPEIE